MSELQSSEAVKLIDKLLIYPNSMPQDAMEWAVLMKREFPNFKGNIQRAGVYLQEFCIGFQDCIIEANQQLQDINQSQLPFWPLTLLMSYEDIGAVAYIKHLTNDGEHYGYVGISLSDLEYVSEYFKPDSNWTMGLRGLSGRAFWRLMGVHEAKHIVDIDKIARTKGLRLHSVLDLPSNQRSKITSTVQREKKSMLTEAPRLSTLTLELLTEENSRQYMTAHPDVFPKRAKQMQDILIKRQIKKRYKSLIQTKGSKDTLRRQFFHI